ncbi:MAG: TlpA family protein disulfide reductase [Candidatus Bathyarchaeota archaeon]|nr:TlpA family protein disulfide reductase [Candidatus Bathyarchaeota archaeon]
MSQKRSKGKKKNRKYYLIPIFVVFILALMFFFITSDNTNDDEQYTDDFFLTDMNGQTFKLSDFQGKVVVLDFMATWCKPCRNQMNELIEVWQKYGDQIVIISVAIDPMETDEELSSFFEEYKDATWIHAKDAPELTQYHEVVAIPTLVISDQNGNIVFRHVGVTSASELINEIEKVI